MSVEAPTASSPLFNSLLGPGRGTPEANTVSALKPTKTAQADFSRLMSARNAGTTDELFGILGRRREQLSDRPLLVVVATALSESAAQYVSGSAAPAVLGALGLTDASAQGRVTDHMLLHTRNFASGILTRKAFTDEQVYRRSVESFWRHSIIPAVLDELTHHPEPLIELAASEWAALLQQHHDVQGLLKLPGVVGDLRDALKNALDLNQRSEPVLDSLSIEGAEHWQQSVRELLSRRIEFGVGR